MKISHVLIGLAVVLAACDSSTRKTPDGLEFKVLKEGDGTVPKSGQLVVFNYKMMDSNDSVWVDTYERGLPEVVSVADSAQQDSEDSFFQMLRMVSEGDSVSFEMPVKEFFKDFVKVPLPPQIDSTLDIAYHVSILQVMDQSEFAAFRDETMKKYEALQAAKKSEQLAKDTVTIDKFLDGEGIKAEKTPSGLRYVITKPGKGANAGPGQTATIQYSGYLLDGTFFDSSVKKVAEEKGIYNAMREPYQPLEVTVDQTSVIPGWHEAIKLMNEGSKATFYIPSSLAYGPQKRSEVIKENSILVFDLELVDIK